MAEQTVGKIPEFTPEETEQGLEESRGIEEEKEAEIEEILEEEKGTPSEPPAEEEPAPAEEAESVDTGKLENTIQGLQQERIRLLNEIAELRGSRRELKQEKLERVEQKIDELKDVNPADVEYVEKILRSKGYIRRDEADSMFYESVKQEETNKFLEEFPEYKIENDPQNLKWNELVREMSLYRRPDNPHSLGFLLRKAHNSIIKVSSDRAPIEARRRQIEIASSGGRGAQRSSSRPRSVLVDEHRADLVRGGFTEEDISNMEQDLSE